MDAPQKKMCSFIAIAAVAAGALFFPLLSLAQPDIRDGDVLKTAASPDVYIVKIYGGKRFKRLILNPVVFQHYRHLFWENVRLVPEETLDTFITSNLVRAAGDAMVFGLYPAGDAGTKRHITNPAKFTELACDWDAIFEINEPERDTYLTDLGVEPGACQGMMPAPPTTGSGPSITPDTGGLTGTYFGNKNLTGAPLLTRVDPAINFAWNETPPSPGIGPYSFSVRWEGQISSTCAGTHTFYTYSDDGMRVWVDGRLIIDDWLEHSPREKSGVVNLAVPQRHALKVEYFANSYGLSVSQLLWQSPCVQKSIVPQSALLPIALQSGSVSDPSTITFWGQYWNLPLGSRPSPTFPTGTPHFERNDFAIDFAWGSGSPAPGIRADNFAARWTATSFFQLGTYTISVTADDGVRMWIDGQLLLDKWFDGSSRTYTFNWASAGRNYPIRIEYYENKGVATAKFEIQRK